MAVKMQLSTDTMQSIANLNKLCGSLEKTAGALNKAADGFKNIKKAMDNNTNSISRMTKAMEVVKTSTAKASAEIKDVSSNTKEASKEQKNLGKEGEKTTSSLFLGFSKVGAVITLTLGTIKKIISSIKNVASKMQDLVKPQAQYIEDLNFLDNAYGRADSSGKKLLDTLEKTVGYDPARLVQTAATFRQLGNALDMDSKIADTLANNLIKLTVDVKSITGQDLGNVAKKFQSAMAGNIRAVRAYGVDVTQAALQQELLRLGIDRQISSLNRAEKSILTYITMSRQLSVANGDLSRTVNSVGNQWEIFQNQIAELGRLIGGFFIPILKGILPVLNGIIMALNTIISMIMSFFGIDAESFAAEFGTTANDIDDVSSAFDDMSSSAGKAGKAAKEAQKSLRGFDKLNNITTPTKSSGGSGSSKTGIGGGIDPNILKGLKEYDLHLEAISNWATKIRDRIMEWLGFTKIVDKDGKLIGWRFEGINKIFNNIYKVINKIFNRIKQNPVLNFIKSIQTIIVPFYGFLYSMFTNEDIFGSLKKIFENVYNTVAPLVKTITKDLGGAFQWLQDNVLKPISDFIDDVFASIWRDTLIPIFNKISKDILPKVIKAFDQMWNKALKPIAGFIGDILSPAIETLTSILSNLWKNILQPIVNFIMSYVLKVVENVWTFLADYLIPTFTTIIGVLKNLWDNILKPIYDFIKNYLLTAIETVTKNIKTMVDDIKKKFSGILDFITKVFKGDWEGAFKDIKKVFDEKFAPLKGIIENIEKAFNKVKGAINKVKDALSGIGNIAGGGLDVIKALLGLKGNGGSGGGRSFATGGIYNNGIWSPVKTYAGGGFPSRGELFLARETRTPELVGRIGSSTAILNNDQILEQMTIAVARGMAAAGSQEKQVNIIAQADTEGLLQFINFKNASKNRQYGL